MARQRDDYDDYDDEPRPRRKRVKKRPQGGGGTVALIIGGVAAGLLLLCGGVCGVFGWRSFAPEDSTSPVPLRQARANYQTRLIANDFTPDGPAGPAPAGFRLIRYAAPVGQLAAYVSVDRRDGRRRPAVIWAHGGFGGVGPDELEKDATLDPFIQAGFVVMSPSWRGENDNPGKFELFYGEVDDALAAIEYVAALPYVDPTRIYMVGHSSGGTITLLTAESTDRLRAAFSLGGAPDMWSVLKPIGVGYGNTPFDWKNRQERRLRSPTDYVTHLKTPTFFLVAEDDETYLADARKMETRARTTGAPFSVHVVPDEDHFSLPDALAQKIADKLRADAGPRCSITFTPQDLR